MPSTSGGSFIPKRSTGRVTPVRASKRVYIFSYIAYVLFFGTLLSVVAIFFLNQQAENNLNKYIELVAEERKAFSDRAQIEAIKKLDDRIIAAEQILNWHLAPSKIFEELEAIVATSIQLDGFTFTRETGSSVKLEFSGATKSFDALMFQRDVMKNSALLASADIIEVSYGLEGTEVEGANRDKTQTKPTTSGEAKVTFTFSDEEMMDKIGYTPLNLSQPEVITDFEDNNEGGIEILSGGSDEAVDELEGNSLGQ